MNIEVQELQDSINDLHEFNPMMGHRGCRLSVTYPEITKNASKSYNRAALTVQKEGIKTLPEIMIPLIGDVKELKYVKGLIVEEVESVFKRKKRKC